MDRRPTDAYCMGKTKASRLWFDVEKGSGLFDLCFLNWISSRTFREGGTLNQGPRSNQKS